MWEDLLRRPSTDDIIGKKRRGAPKRNIANYKLQKRNSPVRAAIKRPTEEDNPWHLGLMDYEVLRRFAHGEAVKDIARNLCISPKTAATYLSRCRDRMEEANNGTMVLKFLRVEMKVPPHRADEVLLANLAKATLTVKQQ